MVPESDVTVVVTDDYLRPALAAWNASSLASGRPWLLVKPVGIETWIGPVFVPGQTACWECLAQRLRGHRKLEHTSSSAAAPTRPSAPRLPHPFDRARSPRRSRNGDHSLDRNRRAIVPPRPRGVDQRPHARTRPPRPHPPSPVPACGSPEPQDGKLPRDMRLRTTQKSAPRMEGIAPAIPRKCSATRSAPESDHGIVSALEPGERTGAAQGHGPWLTPTFAADHNFSDMYDERFFLREGMRRRSGGKGKAPTGAYERALRVARTLLRCLRRNRTTDPGHVRGPWRRGGSPERVHAVQRRGNTRSASHTTAEGTRPIGCRRDSGRMSRSSGLPSGR